MTKTKKFKCPSYQKQGFISLVFVWFFFLSQAGEHVLHFAPKPTTQSALNSYLEGSLFSLILQNSSYNQYRNDVLNRVVSLNQIGDRFDLYESLNIAGSDQYCENRFALRQFRNSELGSMFKSTWNQSQSQLPSNSITKTSSEPLITSNNG